jgi:hypothetical protein
MSHSHNQTGSVNGLTQTNSRSFNQQTATLEANIKTLNDSVWQRQRIYRQPMPADWPILPAGAVATNGIPSSSPMSDVLLEITELARWLPTLVIDPKQKNSAALVHWSDLADAPKRMKTETTATDN